MERRYTVGIEYKEPSKFETLEEAIANATMLSIQRRDKVVSVFENGVPLFRFINGTKHG